MPRNCGPKPGRFSCIWRSELRESAGEMTGKQSDSEAAFVQGELLSVEAPKDGTVVVSHRVTMRTVQGFRVVSLDGQIFQNYPVVDRPAEAYLMATLVNLGYADQNDVARAFGYSVRTLRRFQQRLASGGLLALARDPGRPIGGRTKDPAHRFRDQAILRLKGEGATNRSIARQLGIDEKAIRRRLQQLGWRPPEEQLVLFEDEAIPGSPSEVGPSNSNGSRGEPDVPPQTNEDDGTCAPATCDPNPLDRSFSPWSRTAPLADRSPLRSCATSVRLYTLSAVSASGLSRKAVLI